MVSVRETQLERGVDLYQGWEEAGGIYETVDLGSVVFHISTEGFIAFTACGKCIVGGVENV